MRTSGMWRDASKISCAVTIGNISPRASTQGLYIGIDLKVHKEVVCLFEREVREIAEVSMFAHGVCQTDGYLWIYKT